MLKDKKVEIEAKVNDILAYLSEDVEKISLPIDLDKVLDKFSIVLKEAPMPDGIAGAYEKSNKTIWVSDRDPYVRKVFTVAHELGHYFLHENVPEEILYRDQMVQIASEKKPEEVEANYFAACLLMPEKIIKKYSSFTQDLELLSKIFGVSNTAVNFRLKNLSINQ